MSINSGQAAVFTDPNALTLAEMEKSDIEFHLTGSRFFGIARIDSDYDFYALLSNGNEAWLREHGFRDITLDGNDYMGYFAQRIANNNVAKIYRKGRIDVQLVTDIELKSNIQSLIREAGIMHFLRNSGISKQAMIQFWNLFYNLATMNRTATEPVKTISEDRVKELLSEVVAEQVKKLKDEGVTKPTAEQIEAGIEMEELF